MTHPVNESKISILVADDHEFVRKAICSYIPSLGLEFQVVSEVSDGAAALKAIEELSPNIVVLDLDMPKVNGFDVLRQLRSKNSSSQVKVIILSAHYNEYFFKELVLLGAASYLPKECTSEEFVETVKQVVANGFYINPKVSREIVADLASQKNAPFLLSERRLTGREIEVVDLLSQGLRYKEIAAKLDISVNTVKFHFKSIYRKTLLSNNAALVKYAVRVGIIGVESQFGPKLSAVKPH